MDFDVSGNVSEQSFSSGIDFKAGDYIKVACVDIQPFKTELDSINAKLADDLNGSWEKYAHAKDGILYKFAAVSLITDEGETPLVNFDIEKNKFSFPRGRFGLMFFYKVEQNMLLVGKKDEPKTWKFDAAKSGQNVEFQIKSMPSTWESASPAERIKFWKQACSISLKCGDGRPEIITGSNGGFRLDWTSVHAMEVGSMTTAYVYPRSYEGKQYRFLKSYVENPVPNPKKKYLSKNKYDLFYYDDSAALSKKYCENLLIALTDKSADAESLSFNTADLDEKPVF